MKNIFSRLSLRKAKAIAKDEKGQGATEYILMLAVLIMVVFLAKGKIKSFIEGKMSNAESASQNIFDNGN